MLSTRDKYKLILTPVIRDKTFLLPVKGLALYNDIKGGM